MGRQFNRLVSLTAGPTPSSGRQWSNLRTSFKIVHTNDPKPNQSRIEVYGLAPSDQNFLQQDGVKVILEAGYPANFGAVFAGDINRASTSDRPPDVVTLIEAGDGEDAYLTSKISITLGPGTSTQQIIQTLVDAMGLPLAEISSTVPITDTLTGVTLHGQAYRYLNDYASQLGFTWSIQDGRVQIVTDRESTGAAAISVTPQTGLIGSPEPLIKRAKRGGRPRVVGVKWRMLLQPQARPGQLFQLQSERYQGFYVGQKLTQTGDSGYEDRFFTEVEATEKLLAA